MPADREHRTRLIVVSIIATALILYLIFKTWHVATALNAWEDQPLPGDTAGAAR